MALLHVASKHLGMHVLMFILEDMEYTVDLMVANFDSFPPP